MSRRVYQRGVALSLDSFLDIVTNSVGVLILVAVVTVLTAGDISLSLGTPILHPAPTGAERIVFECRRQRVARLPEKEVNQQFERLMKGGGKEKVDVSDVEYLLGSGSLRDAAFRVKIHVEQGTPFLIYEPRNDVQGETLEEIKNPTSEYQRRIKGADPKTYYLFFIVRDDSFEVFREARRIAATGGLAVGWYPKLLSEPLLFSSGATIGGEVQR
jgi:hypothetical protein